MILQFPAGETDTTGFRSDDAPTKTTLTDDTLYETLCGARPLPVQESPESRVQALIALLHWYEGGRRSVRLHNLGDGHAVTLTAWKGDEVLAQGHGSGRDLRGAVSNALADMEREATEQCMRDGKL